MDCLELKIPPALSFAMVALLMWSSASCFPAWELGWFMCSLGWLAFIAGGVCCLLGLFEFLIHKTTADPRDPHQSSTLVCRGIYAYSRNPMYLGFVLLLASLMLWLGSPLLVFYIVAFIWFLTRYQIEPEERILRYRFGQTYQDYLYRVPRWF
ncbi:methyltransferase family protein [Marinomonas fungiae]|uniref:methyltransferase family protein n=1 Tax=Marinomonas fungiae TaxID=1137284 RepID=UPI003A90CEDE